MAGQVYQADSGAIAKQGKERRIGALLAAMRSKGRENAGPMLLVASGRIGVALGQILLVRISTELLTPAQLGGVSQMVSLAGFFNLLLAVPVGHYVARGFLEWYDAGVLRKHLWQFFVFVLVLALLTAAFAGGIQVQWHLVGGFSPIFVAVLTAIYVFSLPISTLGTTGFNLLKRRVYFAAFANLPIWIGLAASPILFRKYASPEYWSLGQYLGLTAACVSFWFLWRKVGARPLTPVVTHAHHISFSAASVFAFSWPVMITAALWWTQSQSYRFVLDRIQGIANVGLFTVGYSLAATAISMYEGIFGQFYEPIFYGELKGQGVEGQAKAWNNYASAYLPGLAVIGVFVAGASPFLAQVLLGGAFRTVAIQVAFWAAIIETMRAAGGMMYHLGMAKIDNRMTILPVAAGAVLAPIGVLIFGQFDPYLGTIVGLFIAGLTVMVIILATSHRVLPIQWPVARILRAFVLSIPLIVGFEVTHWVAPSLGTSGSLLALAIGGTYLVGVEAWIFSHRTVL